MATGGLLIRGVHTKAIMMELHKNGGAMSRLDLEHRTGILHRTFLVDVFRLRSRGAIEATYDDAWLTPAGREWCRKNADRIAAEEALAAKPIDDLVSASIAKNPNSVFGLGAKL